MQTTFQPLYGRFVYLIVHKIRLILPPHEPLILTPSLTSKQVIIFMSNTIFIIASLLCGGVLGHSPTSNDHALKFYLVP